MSVYNDDGSYNGTNPVSGNLTRNPVHDINERIDRCACNKYPANAYVEFDFAKDFTLRSSVDQTYFSIKETDMLVTLTLKQLVAEQEVTPMFQWDVQQTS